MVSADAVDVVVAVVVVAVVVVAVVVDSTLDASRWDVGADGVRWPRSEPTRPSPSLSPPPEIRQSAL